MYNDDTGRRIMARSITHYAYRNTKLEDYHAENVKMDKVFYRTIYNLVRVKLNNVRLLQRYLDEFPCENINKQEDFNELMKSVPEDLHFKFLKYFQHIMWGQFYGSHWDAAECVTEIADGQSYAGYVLAGKFLECCNDGVFLDDAAMRVINKDVHNRIYSLLIGGYFNK